MLQVLNQIVYELPPEHPLSDTRPLKEVLGHTPSQVSGCLLEKTTHLVLTYHVQKIQVGAGAVLGFVVSYIISLIFPVSSLPGQG